MNIKVGDRVQSKKRLCGSRMGGNHHEDYECTRVSGHIGSCR